MCAYIRTLHTHTHLYFSTRSWHVPHRVLSPYIDDFQSGPTRTVAHTLHHSSGTYSKVWSLYMHFMEMILLAAGACSNYGSNTESMDPIARTCYHLWAHQKCAEDRFGKKKKAMLGQKRKRTYYYRGCVQHRQVTFEERVVKLPNILDNRWIISNSLVAACMPAQALAHSTPGKF
jgi:hypothetical protein